MSGAFQTRIMQLIDKARREGWTPLKFETELNRLLFEFNINEKEAKKVKADLNAMLKQVNALSIGIISEVDVKNMINYYNWKTIKTNEKFKRDMTKAFTDHINDVNYKELRNKVKSIIATKKHYQETILNTTMAGIDNAKNIATKTAEYIKHFGKEPKFKYTGAPPERGFCKEHWNKSYTLTEIKAMDNGQGLPVLINGGGYNCRHYWVVDMNSW